MKKSEIWYYKPFSHIYVEKDVKQNKMTLSLLKRFEGAKIIEINHYKDIFNRKNQAYAMQKSINSLIIAKNTGELVYKGAPFCQSFGEENFYYTSFVLNCLYDCEYCYLRGLYPSAYMTVFVNTDDYLKEVEEKAGDESCFLCVSYDTDLGAVEDIFGFCALWYDFAKNHRNIKVELRTKCADLSFLKGFAPIPNFIIAITLSPEETAGLYEGRAPSLFARLKAGASVVEMGFPLRLSFDPVLVYDNFEEVYGRFIDRCFREIDPEKVLDIGLGGFRVAPACLKNMRRNYPLSRLLSYPYETVDGACRYGRGEDECIDFIIKKLENYVDKKKICLWNT